MTNNDVFRRLRYIFDFDDTRMMAIFALAGPPATRAEISSWLKKEGAEGYQDMEDLALAVFLNGLITDQRGKKDGPQPVPENRLSNNMIFTKLKIALNLKADDILEMLRLADFEISRHELSAFFRKVGHKHYRKCKDQALRNFLQGMQLKYRGESEQKPETTKPEKSKAAEKPPVDSDNEKPRESIWPTNFKR